MAASNLLEMLALMLRLRDADEGVDGFMGDDTGLAATAPPTPDDDGPPTPAYEGASKVWVVLRSPLELAAADAVDWAAAAASSSRFV